MSFLAAPFAAKRSVYSSCSFFLSSVASATCLSSALMPSIRPAMSSASAAMDPFASSMAVSRSTACWLRALCSSSDLSSSASQKAFFSSSAFCSLPSRATMSSIILTTLSKEPVLPRKARAMRLRRASLCPYFARADLITISVRRFTSALVTLVCRNAGLGNVLLKSSRASSSFKILMVSASATSSSARVLERSSHSACLVLQPVSRSARYFLSSRRALEVSSKSAFMASICTPTCPTRSSFDSIAFVFAFISFVFAAASASKSLMACSSVEVSSARPFSMVSFICFKMSTISMLPGEPAAWERKEDSWSRSAVLRSMSMVSLRKVSPVDVCRKLVRPPSRAVIAFPRAAMFDFESEDSLAKAAASFSRIAVALASASLASSRSCLCCATSLVSCSCFAVPSARLLSSMGTFASASPMLFSRSPTPFLQ
mmetsp:Transcript_25323/g.80494  ORF Transcript_25323/g.80494 Transcript_25323/m.80494 type:complete len:429 (-) Transcript_25323:188-1474(-)